MFIVARHAGDSNVQLGVQAVHYSVFTFCSLERVRKTA